MSLNFGGFWEEFKAKSLGEKKIATKPVRDVYTQNFRAKSVDFESVVSDEILSKNSSMKNAPITLLIDVIKKNLLWKELVLELNVVVELASAVIAKSYNNTVDDGKARAKIALAVVGWCLINYGALGACVVQQCSESVSAASLGLKDNQRKILTREESLALVEKQGNIIFSKNSVGAASDDAMKSLKLSAKAKETLGKYDNERDDIAKFENFKAWLDKTDFKKINEENNRVYAYLSFMVTVLKVIGSQNEFVRSAIQLIELAFTPSQSSAKSLDISIDGKDSIDDLSASRVAESVSSIRKDYSDKRDKITRTKELTGGQRNSQRADLTKKENEVIAFFSSFSILYVVGRTILLDGFSLETSTGIKEEVSRLRDNAVGLEKDAKVKNTSFYDQSALLKAARSAAFSKCLEFRAANFADKTDTDLANLLWSKLTPEERPLAVKLMPVLGKFSLPTDFVVELGEVDRRMVESYLTPAVNLARVV